MKTKSKVMTEKQAAQYVGLSQRTLQAYRFKRIPPTYIKVGRVVRYRQDDLDDFLEANRVDPLEA